MGYSPWGHKELDTTEQLGTGHTELNNTQVITISKLGYFHMVLRLWAIRTPNSGGISGTILPLGVRKGMKRSSLLTSVIYARYCTRWSYHLETGVSRSILKIKYLFIKYLPIIKLYFEYFTYENIFLSTL